MPPSETDASVPGQALATAAEALYLINLLLLPGLAFLLLLWLYRRHARTAPPLARCHLRQTVSASLWAGVLLVAANLVIIGLGGYAAPYTWVVVVLYFTTAHATLVLLGTLALAKAMAGRAYRYPLVGRSCADLGL
jgi:uncharacterized Tic20 family protein